MPVTLRSGLKLLLSGDAPFDPGTNWFKCPPGHFWIKVAAPEMGQPLFDAEKEVWHAFEYAELTFLNSAPSLQVRSQPSHEWRSQSTALGTQRKKSNDPVE